MVLLCFALFINEYNYRTPLARVITLTSTDSTVVHCVCHWTGFGLPANEAQRIQLPTQQ